MCFDFEVGGVVDITVELDGSVSGTFAGSGFGDISGMVDDAGVFSGSGTSDAAGDCEFVGAFDEDDTLTGTWECEEGDCAGEWSAFPC